MLKMRGAFRGVQTIWRVPEIIFRLSEHFEMAPGDVILAGTPVVVDPVEKGDAMECRVDGLGKMMVRAV